MALRTIVLVLALLAAVVVADEFAASTDTTSNSLAFTDFGEDAVESSDFTGTPVGEESLEAAADDEEEDANAVIDAADAEPEEEVNEDDATLPEHPLARILTSRSSKHCWSAKNCKKFYKKPGCCKKKCVNLAGDNKNCGKCGKCCNTKEGYSCVSGKCVRPKYGYSSHTPHTPLCGKNKRCSNGFTCCSARCVALKSNNSNCGKCGRRCNSGYSCKSGKCSKTSPPPSAECSKHKKCKNGKSCCSGKCVSFSSDNNHCGTCHKRCDSSKGYMCKSHKCVKNPSPPHPSQCGKTTCKHGQTCCNGKCASLPSDNSNCGSCGKSCDGKKGFACKNSQCVLVSPFPSQCGKDKKCPGSETCCKGKCVNLKNNNGHCGKCDNGCGYGSACCNGTCKNVKNDDRNCGKCGKSCGFSKKCCHGYCINIFGSDNHHCGACGKKCPTTCKLGMCGYGA